VAATINSSTHERKVRYSIYFKNGCIYLKARSFDKDIPITIMLKTVVVETNL